MRFLKKLGIANFDDHFVEDFLKPLEKRYINYQTLYTPDFEANDDDLIDDDIEKQSMLKSNK